MLLLEFYCFKKKKKKGKKKKVGGEGNLFLQGIKGIQLCFFKKFHKFFSNLSSLYHLSEGNKKDKLEKCINEALKGLVKLSLLLLFPSPNLDMCFLNSDLRVNTRNS